MTSGGAYALYSVGHGNRSGAEFVKLLRTHGIRSLIDVRAYPSSRRHPQFSRANLEPVLKESAITYLWLGDTLGGFRKADDASIHVALTSSAMRAYADHMNSEMFRTGVARLLVQAQQTPTIMMCAERLPQQCHRALISDYVTAHAATVLHLLDETATVAHCLNPAARATASGLIYDCDVDQQLRLDW